MTAGSRLAKQRATLGMCGATLVALLRRIPLSLAMMLVTTASAIATGAIGGQTSPADVQRWGYSLDHLRDGRVWTVFTGDWFVYGATHWSSMLLLFALFAVPLEAIAGSRLLAVAFWLGSPGGTILTSLLVHSLGGWLDWHPHPDLIAQADIGGSVGTWSAAGALHVLLSRQPGRLLWPARLGAAAYLCERLLINHGSADVAHVLGLLIGTGVGLSWTRGHGMPSRFRALSLWPRRPTRLPIHPQAD